MSILARHKTLTKSKNKNRSILRFLTKLVGVYIGFIIIQIIFVAAFWSKSYFIDFGERPAVYSLDLRHNLNKRGREISFVATQAEPEKFWLMGHMWVQFEKPPPDIKTKSRQFGYYPNNEYEAVKELAKSMIGAWGYIVGQKPVSGTIRSDDALTPHLILNVKVDSETYSKALEVDALWRQQNQYLILPSWGQQTYTCQDYALSIAGAIGLKTLKSHITEFPAETFIKLARANGIKVSSRISLGSYWQAKHSS